MLASFITLFLASWIQSPIQLGRFWDCRIMWIDSKDRLGAPERILEVVQGGKVTWHKITDLAKPTVGSAMKFERFYISDPGTFLAIFRRDGSLVKEICYPATGDPRPLLVSGHFAIVGADVYNLPAGWSERETLDDLSEDRLFWVIDLRSGAKTLLPNLFKGGEPVAIVGSHLFCIIPMRRTLNWKRAPSHYWLSRSDLPHGGRVRWPIRVDRQGVWVIQGLLYGWGPFYSSMIAKDVVHLGFRGDEGGLTIDLSKHKVLTSDRSSPKATQK